VTHCESVKAPRRAQRTPALLTSSCTSAARAAAALIWAASVTYELQGDHLAAMSRDEGREVLRGACGRVDPDGAAGDDASTMASPMPRLAPVTSAVVPAI